MNANLHYSAYSRLGFSAALQVMNQLDFYPARGSAERISPKEVELGGVLVPSLRV